MYARGAADADDLLYKAISDDEFPTDIQCLQTFGFDRCMEWSMLLGLWQGVRIIQCLGAGETEDQEENRRQVLQRLAEVKQEVRQAVAEGRVFAYIDETYAQHYCEHQTPKSGYWLWYEGSRATLKLRANAARSRPEVDRRVQLKGLTAKPQLNGAAGTVVGVDPDSGRFAIRLESPRSAIAIQPNGVRVKQQNLEMLPPGASRAVLVSGRNLGAAFAFCPLKDKSWQRSHVPIELGIPLMYIVLAGAREQPDRSLAKLIAMMRVAWSVSDVDVNSMGLILVARSDGVDLTVHELQDLLDYLRHLKATRPQLPQPRGTLRAWANQHITPAAYQAYLRHRQQQVV